MKVRIYKIVKQNKGGSEWSELVGDRVTEVSKDYFATIYWALKKKSRLFPCLLLGSEKGMIISLP
jgi:hypothetical protein